MTLDTLTRPAVAHRLPPFLVAALGAALLATSPLASAVQAVPQSALFSGALVDIDGGDDPSIDFEFKFDTTVAEAINTELGYHSKAASDYGVNKAYSKVNGGSSLFGPFAYAVSAWADSFTITGGSGEFTTDVSVTLSGQFGPGSYSEAAYGLFAVSSEFYGAVLDGGSEFVFELLLAGFPTDPGVQDVIFLGASSEDGDYTPGSFTAIGQVNGTYGETFYLVSVLATYAEEDGEINMFDTAVFGITGPAGGELLTGSGTPYAPAVPEPGTYALCAVGLALIFGAHRRTRQRNA
jgi:hypothetical protein